MREFSHYCPCCGKPIMFGDCTGESGIYGSHNVSELCEPCWLDEERETDEKGTNNFPDRLVMYRLNDIALNNI